MEYAEAFKHEASEMRYRIATSIEWNLKRIGITHEADDNVPLEFFHHTTTDIVGINANGTLMGVEGTIRGFIEDEKINIEDSIALLEELEQI